MPSPLLHLTVGCLLAATAAAAETELQKIISPTPVSEGRFGLRVAARLGRIVAGEPGAPDGGRAHVYRRQAAGWVHEATLAPGGPGSDSNFGISVDIDDDVAVVGASFHVGPTGLTGAAYVFRRTGTAWTQEAQLVPAAAEDFDSVGDLVAIDGDVALVGASGDDGAGEFAGAAYVFRRIDGTWTEEAKLIGSHVGPHDVFGRVLDVEGDTAVFGGPSESPNGSIYVFRRGPSGWQQEARLVASDVASGDRFGDSISIDQGIVVAGAPLHDQPATFAGAAYVFEPAPGGGYTEWKLTAPHVGVGDRMGWSVAIDGDLVAVGISDDNLGATNAGSAVVFRRVGADYVEVHHYTASDFDSADHLGASVALSADDLVAGTSNDEGPGVFGAGSIYLYCNLRPEVPWTDHGHATSGALGPPHIEGEGDLLPKQAVTLSLTGARPHAAALLVVGFEDLSSARSGVLVVPAPEYVTAGLVTDATGAAVVVERWPQDVPCCFVTYMQVLIEDPTAPAGVAASNALSTVTR